VSRVAAQATVGRLPTQVPLAVGLAAVCLAAGALTTRSSERLPEQLVMALPLAALAAAAYFALAALRPAAAIGIAFALLAVVTTDPAPPDLAFALLIVGTLGIVPPPALPGFVLVPLVLLTTVTLASAMNANDTARAIEYAGITIYLVVLAVWLTGVFRVERYARIALKAYLVTASLSGLLGVLALYVGFPGSTNLLFGDVRVQGLFQDPNVYGAFLVPAAAIMLDTVTRTSVRRRGGLLAACGFVVVSGGVVVAFSRAGWLAYGLAVSAVVVVQAFRRGGPRAAARGALLLGCGMTAAYLMLSTTGSLDFFNTRSQVQGYDEERFQTQSSAFELMTTHLLGFGPGQTEVELAYATHSLYARLAYEQGLFGLGLIVVILLVTLWCALVVAVRAPTVFGVGTAGLLGSWIGLVANSAFIDTVHWRHLWIFAAVIWTAYIVTGKRGGVRRFA
jgi:hypothetical protein